MKWSHGLKFEIQIFISDKDRCLYYCDRVPYHNNECNNKTIIKFYETSLMP
jgi:hypothetical protein